MQKLVAQQTCLLWALSVGYDPRCGVKNRSWYVHPDSKVHGANMGPTLVLSAQDGLHVGPMSLCIKALTLRE